MLAFMIRIIDILVHTSVDLKKHMYIPGTCSSFIVVVEPSKSRSKLQLKQGSFGFQVHKLYIK